MQNSRLNEANKAVGTPKAFRESWLAPSESFNEGIRKVCVEYAKNWPTLRENNQWMVLAGPTGAGKTWGAAGAMHRIHDTYRELLSTTFYWFSCSYTMQRMLEHYHFREQEKYSAIKLGLYTSELLLVDDLLLVSDYPQAKQLIYSVYDYRDQHKLPTITTLNGQFSARNPEIVSQAFNHPFARRLARNAQGYTVSMLS